MKCRTLQLMACILIWAIGLILYFDIPGLNGIHMLIIIVTFISAFIVIMPNLDALTENDEVKG